MLLRETIGNFLATEEPAAHDLELWLFAEDGHTTEGVFASMLGSVHETIHQVIRDMLLISFTLINVVVEVPEGPAIPVEHFIEGVNTLSFLVLVVHVERLEIVEIERGLWQGLDVVTLWLWLLFLWFCCWGWLWLLFFLSLGVGDSHLLHWLGSKMNSSLNLREMWSSVKTCGPFSDFLDCFLVSTIEDSLEWFSENNGDDDIGQGHLSANEPSITLDQSIVNSLDVILQFLVCLLPVTIVDLISSVDSLEDLFGVWQQIGASPVDPLVDLGAVKWTVSTIEEASLAADMLADGNGSTNISTFSFEDWELPSWVLSLEFFAISLLLGHELELELLSEKLGDDLDDVHLG